MSLLRNLRNLAMLVILLVGSVGLTPRLAQAASCPSVGCGSHLRGCHPCAGRCFSCVDLDQNTHCTFCKG